jgi:hypothetical protein
MKLDRGRIVLLAEAEAEEAIVAAAGAAVVVGIAAAGVEGESGVGVAGTVNKPAQF